MPERGATENDDGNDKPPATLPKRPSIPATMTGSAKAPIPHPSDLVAGLAPTTSDTRAALIEAIATLGLGQLRLVAALLVRLKERYPDGLPEWDHARRDEIVEAMLAAIPDSDLYDPQIGMFYTLPGVRRMKHLTKVAVLRKVRAGHLLAILSADGYVFPEFQFSARGDVPDLLPKIIAILRSAELEPWHIALWMTKSSSGRLSAIDLLKSGNGVAAVRRARASAKRVHHDRGL